MKSIYIELTDEQKEKLSPLFSEVVKHSDTKPVMLLSQIYFDFFDAVAVCRIIDNEKSLKIQSIFGDKKVGKIAKLSRVEQALKKARA